MNIKNKLLEYNNHNKEYNITPVIPRTIYKNKIDINLKQTIRLRKERKSNRKYTEI